MKTNPTAAIATNSYEISNLRRAVEFYRNVRAENHSSESRECEDATTWLIAAAMLVIDRIDIDSTECNEKSGGVA